MTKSLKNNKETFLEALNDLADYSKSIQPHLKKMVKDLEEEVVHRRSIGEDI